MYLLAVGLRNRNIPDVNDSFTFENLIITVTEVDSHRAATIKVEKQDVTEQEEKD